ncbi:MAG: MFS transporter [Polycyclovorans sp.]|nr:MFS transporter [Gammaproteobacteria bacterium]
MAPLLGSVALLLLGVGLLNTFLAVQAAAMGWAPLVIGGVMSAYFIGYGCGTFATSFLIRRTGHIRAFAVFAALASCTVIGHALTDAAWAWALLRVLTGASLVGLYAVTESWLAAEATGSERGRFFAAYMVVNLLALAAGQFLMVLAPSDAFVLFGVITLLINLSLIPVAMTRLNQPAPPLSTRLRLGVMSRAAPSAAITAAVSGLAMGALWGLLPAQAQLSGASALGIAILMSTAILGGAAGQWPIGRYSDGRDRRRVMRLLAIVALGVSLALATLSQWLPWSLSPLVFCYGVLAFSAYPLAIAHLADRLPAEDLLEGASVMLLLHGVGAALGPTLAGLLMNLLGPSALFIYFALCWALLAVLLHARLRVESRQAPVGEAATFMPMLRTSAVALEAMWEDAAAAQAEPAVAPEPPPPT